MIVQVRVMVGGVLLRKSVTLGGGETSACPSSADNRTQEHVKIIK